MKKTLSYVSFFSVLFLLFLPSCKKIKSCNANPCSSERITKEIVTDQKGIMGVFMQNNDRRWMINVFEDMSQGVIKTCIICGDIPDSLKLMNKQVVFSGELKDACGYVDAEDQKRFFIITPTAIR